MWLLVVSSFQFSWSDEQFLGFHSPLGLSFHHLQLLRVLSSFRFVKKLFERKQQMLTPGIWRVEVWSDSSVKCAWKLNTPTIKLIMEKATKVQKKSHPQVNPTLTLHEKVCPQKIQTGIGEIETSKCSIIDAKSLDDHSSNENLCTCTSSSSSTAVLCSWCHSRVNT